MFDIGGTEIMVILVVVLILFGGDKLPEFARGLGKSIREFKKATSGIEEEFKRAMEEPPKPVKKPVWDEAAAKASARPASPLEPPPAVETPGVEHGEK
ncbi:MAG: twin-arginine translocase TatA/TatE family subunit [Opitutaceae bacterium]